MGGIVLSGTSIPNGSIGVLKLTDDVIGNIVLPALTVPTVPITKYASSTLTNGKTKAVFSSTSTGTCAIMQTNLASALSVTSNRGITDLANATDGDLSTEAHITMAANNDYWKLDLGSVLANKLAYFQWNSSNAGTVFSLQSSVNGSDWTDLETGITGAGIKYRCFEIASFQYIRILVTSFVATQCQCYELIVFDDFDASTTAPARLTLTPASYTTSDFFIFTEGIKPYSLGTAEDII